MEKMQLCIKFGLQSLCMKKEFISSNGKVEIERNVIYVKTMLYGGIENTAFGKLLFPSMIVLYLVLTGMGDFDNPLKLIISSAVCGIMGASYVPQVYDILFKKSFATRIPMDRIVSFELRPDTTGLETQVILHLRNGRYRSIKFRTLEKQYEPFTDLLSQNLSQPQIAR